MVTAKSAGGEDKVLAIREASATNVVASTLERLL